MAVLLKTLQSYGQNLPVATELNTKLSDTDSTLTIVIEENKGTYDAIAAITKMWTITGVEGPEDEREYRIVMLDKETRGQKNKLTIKARPVEIDDLNNSRVYEIYNGSFTGKAYFDLVFKDTGYKYNLHAKVSSSKFENLGNCDTNLEMFKKGLERYSLEYEYDPKTKTFHLYDYIEYKPEYWIKSGVNANNIKIQEDASKCYTFIKGFGGFTDQQTFEEASLQFEYTSPLADVIGMRHAPPIQDGRITKEDTLKAKMEKVINDSVKTSVTLDFVYLKKYFKNATPKVGDVVKVIDDLMGLNVDLRIIEMTTKRDINGEIIKMDLVLGEFRLQDRYVKAVGKAAKYVTNLKTSNPAKTQESVEAQTKANTKTTQDLLTKTDDLDNKIKKADAKSVTTSNGTIVHDFTSKSSIRKIKSIGTIGDSIAKGSLAKKNFTQMLAKKLKAKYTNLAESGATMSDIYQQATKIKGDLIILQGTDGDWVKNIDIGTDKTDTKTFYGAFYSAVEVIKKNNPKAKLLVMTPARQCYVEGSKVKRKDTEKNDKDKALVDYVNLQVDICNDLNIPVFDAYRYPNFKPYSPAFRKSTMPDGVHFNDKGHEVIMYELIKDYYQFYDE